MNIYDRLKADHFVQRELVERLLEKSDGAEFPVVFDVLCDFDALCDEIEAHNAAEEQTLHAALLTWSRDQGLVRHGIDGHDEVADLLNELAALPVGGDDWMAGLRRLAESLERHFVEEENETFAAARQMIDADLSVELSARFDRAKRDWLEIFGRVPPAERKPQVTVPRNDVDPFKRPARRLLRGRPGSWFARWRRPGRNTGTARSGSASGLLDSLPPSKAVLFH